MIQILYKISVIIPVRNESKHIANVLDSLTQQDYEPELFEILVIDGESEDDTRKIVAEYAKRFSNVRLLNNPKQLSSAARNIGIENATGEIVLLVDGHCIIGNKRLLANVSEAFEKSGADCLGRPQPLELQNANATQLAIAAARRSWLGHHPDSFIYADEECFSPAISVAVAYKKDVFEKVGIFDERFDASEDAELNYRVDKAKLRCYFTPKIAVHYVPRNSVAGLAKQLIRYGKGRSRMAKKHPETFSWKSNLPALFVFCLLIGFLPALVYPAGVLSHAFWQFGSFIYFGVVSFYLAIVLAESLRIVIKKRLFHCLFHLPIVFMTIHLASGWGVLSETIKR